jgi:CheY-like chemotaxis protein
MSDLNPSSRLRVLLPDEQEEWHHTVRRLLEPQGVQTVSARSGREAIDLIESNSVHVAVLDVQMPQLGGMQVVRRLRELQKGHPQRLMPPSILVANDLTSHLLREALMNHVFSVLSKPVDYGLLLDALARVVRRHYESRWPGFS